VTFQAGWDIWSTEKSVFFPAGNRTLDCPAHTLITKLIELSQLPLWQKSLSVHACVCERERDMITF
jgi:hypothetical protein